MSERPFHVLENLDDTWPKILALHHYQKPRNLWKVVLDNDAEVIVYTWQLQDPRLLNSVLGFPAAPLNINLWFEQLEALMRDLRSRPAQPKLYEVTGAHKRGRGYAAAG